MIYAVDHKAEAIRLMAVGHRRSIYEELTDRIRKIRRRNADRQNGSGGGKWYRESGTSTQECLMAPFHSPTMLRGLRGFAMKFRLHMLEHEQFE